jgi:hypothetical protein
VKHRKGNERVTALLVARRELVGGCPRGCEREVSDESGLRGNREAGLRGVGIKCRGERTMREQSWRACQPRVNVSSGGKAERTPSRTDPTSRDWYHKSMLETVSCNLRGTHSPPSPSLNEDKRLFAQREHPLYCVRYTQYIPAPFQPVKRRPEWSG